MKKFIPFLVAIPILLGFTFLEKPQNLFVFSKSVVHSTNNGAWQIFASTTSRKNVSIGQITLAPQATTEFIIYSTNVATGFTGTKLGGSVYSSNLGSGNVAVSSFVYCAAASAPTGDVVWRGIVPASTTANISYFGGDNVFTLKPPQAIFVYTNGGSATNQFTDVTFFFKEEYQ